MSNPAHSELDKNQEVVTLGEQDNQSHAPTEQQDNYQPQAQPRLSLFQKVSNLLDSTTFRVYEDLWNGYQWLGQQRSTSLIECAKMDLAQRAASIKSNCSPPKGGRSVSLIRSAAKLEPEQIDEHRKRVREFMKQGSKFRRKMRDFSVVMEREQQQQAKQREEREKEQLLKTIEGRRAQAQYRMESKKQLRDRIRQSIMEGDSRLSQVRKQVRLYERKQSQFQHDWVLPKIEEETRVLEEIKKERSPMNIQQLLNHEKSYSEKKLTLEAQRSIASRVNSMTNSAYKPPQYVSKSYKLIEEEEEEKRQQQLMKELEVAATEVRRKQFTEKIYQQQKLELDAIEGRQNSVSIVLASAETIRRQDLSPEAKRNLGNDYLRQLLTKIRNKPKKPQTQASIQPSLTTRPQSISTISYSPMTQRPLHQLRQVRLAQIARNSKTDSQTKYQLLRYETDKLDKKLGMLTRKNKAVNMVKASRSRHLSQDNSYRPGSLKVADNLHDNPSQITVTQTTTHTTTTLLHAEELAGTYLNSIQAKLMMLEVIKDNRHENQVAAKRK